MNDILHIVCLDAPSPPDYGGAIDMYYKIISLARSGKKIILHYFEYREDRNVSGLENYCIEINAYTRKGILNSLSISKPYIVTSRTNQSLIERLNKDQYPILLEGIHCTGIVPFLSKNRGILVRLHNDEAEYYKRLALSERSFIKRTYYAYESRLLRNYQRKLPGHLTYACISNEDIQTLNHSYGLENLFYIPGFLPWQQVTSKTGTGNYCLYHGNMSVAENEAAVIWLIRQVFSQINIPFIIAGKSISPELQKIAGLYGNVKLFTDPTERELEELINLAQIHVLPSLNQTGVKFKVLHALFSGRFCLTNCQAIRGSNLEKGVVIANKAEEMIDQIKFLYSTPFSETDRSNRIAILSEYNNEVNVKKLIELLKHYQ